MTKKAEFNADEWSTLVEAPLLAGMRVMAAERGGTLRESMAMGQTYAHARQQHGDSELLDELVASPPAMDPERLRAAGDIGAASTQRLHEAVGIVEQKATAEELDAYKRFVLSLAETVANAHKEGGVLGIGGKPVSDDEQAVLDDLSTTLSAGAAPGGGGGAPSSSGAGPGPAAAA